MKLKKSLVNQYNLYNSVIAVTSYPEAGLKYAQNQDAVASFAKNRLAALKSRLDSTGGKLIVVTDYKNSPEIYIENDILVLRVFKKNSPTTFRHILGVINNFGAVKNVLVEFEFAAFGQTRATSVLPLVLLGIKLAGKNLTIELHQVLADLGQLAGHLGHKKNSLRNQFFTRGLRGFYWLLGQLADRLIVLEDELKQRLETLTGRMDIEVIPHGVDSQLTRLTQAQAKKKLGIKPEEFVVLNFGFLTWYKGSDFVVKTFANSGKLKRSRVKLVLAGGESFNQKDKSHYQAYYRKTTAQAAGHSNIVHTGFVAESDLGLYFSAADLVVLPYRTFMSSSGPLSLALSYRKPFILSESLSAYTRGEDFQAAFKSTRLKPEEIVFRLSHADLEAKILSLQKDKPSLKRLTRLSQELAARRSFDQLSQQYLDLFFGVNFAPTGKLVFGS